jgi:2-polyprenyl-3-methyl-5-hydroxy-6-metoxy-1,4-benzoquinol methylase
MASRDAYQAYYTEVGKRPEFLMARYNPGRMAYFKPCIGQTILDLGCGTGGSLIVYGSRCPAVGVEVSPTLARTAKRVLKLKGVEAEVNVGFIEDFDDPRRFDHVIVTEVLEHVFDPVTVLKVARKHLAEAGQVYMSAPAIKTGGPSHVRGVPYEALKGWLAEAGLSPFWWVEEPNQRAAPNDYMRTVCKAVAA